MVDPYLMKGIPCYIWPDRGKDGGIELLVFLDYWDNPGKGLIPRFRRIDKDYMTVVSPVYQPIGTEWDFAPDWAICSTVEADGNIHFWNEIPEIWNRFQQALSGVERMSIQSVYFEKDPYEGWRGSSGAEQPSTHFKCPERSRYEGEAWRSSMRMRPEWAKVKHLGIEWFIGGRE